MDKLFEPYSTQYRIAMEVLLQRVALYNQENFEALMEHKKANPLFRFRYREIYFKTFSIKVGDHVFERHCFYFRQITYRKRSSVPTTKHIKKGPNGYPKGAVFRDFIGIKTGHKMLRNEMVDFVNAANKMCDDYVVLFRTISELENCRIYFNNLDDPWTLMHNK